MVFYDRYILPALVECACNSGSIRKERALLAPEAEGVVLEVGAGAGANFQFYDKRKVSRVHAVEPSAGMIERAQKRLDQLTEAPPIDLHEAGGEAVPLEDHSVDTVVFTFVLCTIPDWRATLVEARRVLRPGGRALFVEHGLSPDPGVAKWQNRLEPLQKRFGGGCHLTRSAETMFVESGFRFSRLDKGYMPDMPSIAKFSTYLYRGVAQPA